MIDLILSIACSSLIFILFKIFPKYKVDTFQAVVANYFTAFTCGYFLFSGPEMSLMNLSSEQFYWAWLCGFLFISLFVIMGLSSQINGVGTTSVSVKMSMALSVVSVLLLTHLPVPIMGYVGILTALIGVFLVSYNPQGKDETNSSQNWMLLVLFLGSAVLDLVLFVIQKYVLKTFHPGLFSALGFLLAGLMGGIFLMVKMLQSKTTFNPKSWLFGVILGIPNFFSIYLLINAYDTTGWSASKVLSIANIGVVALSSLLGLLVFQEKFSAQKIYGLLTCLAALGLCFWFL